MSFVSCRISEALFKEASGFLISWTRSVEKFSACLILFCSSSVMSSKELDNKPSSSFLSFKLSIFVVFCFLSLIVFV